jgi:hypothetical protein
MRKLFAGILLLAALAFSAPAIQGSDAAARPARMVFAHYMVGIPTYGGGSRLEDYQREITDVCDAVLVFAAGSDRLRVLKPDSTGGHVAPDDSAYAVAEGDPP